jgi:putative transposase
MDRRGFKISIGGENIMGKQKWQSEEKLAVVMEGLKNESSVVEICRAHGVNQALYYRWRDQFLSNAKEIFNNGRVTQGENILKNRIMEMERIIGKLTIQIEILKKTEEMISS